MSVLEYAVSVLKVDNVIVCRQYGCGGVRASLLPLSDALPHVNRRIALLCALARDHSGELDAISTLDSRIDRLAELSALQQVRALPVHPSCVTPNAAARSWLDLRSARWPYKVLSSGDPADADTGGEAAAPSIAAAEMAKSAEPMPAPSAAQRVIEISSN